MPIDRRHTWKPPQGTPIDPRAGLARGLAGFFALNEGSTTAIDCAGGLTAAPHGGISTGSGPYGPALSFDGTSGYLGPVGDATTYDFVQNTLVFTIACRFRLASTSGTQSFLCTNAGSSTNKGFWFASNLDTSQAPEIWITNGVGGSQVVDATGPAGSLADTDWHHLAVTGGGATNAITFYLDGVPLATTYVGGASSPSSGPAAAAPVIGCYTASTTAGDYFGGLLDHLMAWSRTLSAGEVRELARNPWQVFAPRPYYGLLRARATYSLAAGPGAYALSGDPAALLAGRALPASTGGYSLSGDAALLFADRSLAAGPGSYSLAGAPAALLGSRLIAAGPGVYTLVGAPADLTGGSGSTYTLAVGPGSYALAGDPAALAAARTLAASPGAYSLSGDPAGLLIGFTMDAGAGAYSLAGDAAGLLAARTLAAAPGSYSLAGDAATLLLGYTMDASAGAYALAGDPAALARSYAVVASAGSYALSGLPAALASSGTSYAGDDVLAAIYAWWQANGSVRAYSSDGLLWHKQAPQGAVLPFTTFFIVHEVRETWTTGYPWVRASVQVNSHAATDVDARAAATAIRKALKGARLVVDGQAVTHCLPDASGLTIGKGLGPGGQDCWIAFTTFDICWTE